MVSRFNPRCIRGLVRRAGATALVVAVVLAALLTATDAWACPMCKAALGSQGRGHGDLVGGFFWSILFMLSMPFLILGGLSAYMYWLVRQARQLNRVEADVKRLGAAQDRCGSGVGVCDSEN